MTSSSLTLGESDLTSLCPFGIANGYAQDVSYVLRRPINLGMIGTLITVNCPASCLLLI